MITHPLTDRYAVARLRIVAAPALCIPPVQNLSRLALSLISLGGRALFIPIARSIGLDPRSPEFRALEAAAEAARKVMEEV